MTDKNKDELLKGILDLVDSSSNKYLQTLFPDRPDPNNKKKPPTAGDRIKSSANALVENLMRSQPSYIRTIKPNQNKSATEYDTQAILHQIKYLGLQENIRVRRAGFAWARTFEKVVERFYLLSPNTSYAGEYTWTGDARTGCERILTDVGIARDEWQMGVTKAFTKNPETLFALEAMRDKYWHRMATRIQRAWRNFILYRHECARRIQRMWMNKKEALVYAALRDYGHQVLQGRKERRRFSLISMRRFMGDYLDVGHGNGGGSAEGEMLRRAAGLGRDETVAFSSRVELLISRLGRSSKPSPRFLIMTDKAVYFIITQLVNKQPGYSSFSSRPLRFVKAKFVKGGHKSKTGNKSSGSHHFKVKGGRKTSTSSSSSGSNKAKSRRKLSASGSSTNTGSSNPIIEIDLALRGPCGNHPNSAVVVGTITFAGLLLAITIRIVDAVEVNNVERFLGIGLLVSQVLAGGQAWDYCFSPSA